MTGALRSELRKIFTTRLWWGLLIGVLVVDAALAALFGLLVGADFGGPPEASPFGNPNVSTLQLVYSAGFAYYISPLFPLVLGIMLITTEFRHQTVTATYLATPRRWVVILAKVVAAAVVGALYAVVHDVAAVAGGAATLIPRGQPTYLGEPEIWQTLGISVVTFVCWVLLGFGFGLLVRNQVAAIMVAVGVAFVAQIALNIVFSVVGWDSVPRWLPGNLSVNMLVSDDPTGGAQAQPQESFSWWVSALILAGYAAVLTAVGAVLDARRDIS